MMVKKIVIWIVSLIAIGVAAYVGFIGYVVFSFASGCGMDDGPFKARLISNMTLTDSIQTFDLKGGKLVLKNGNLHSPIFSLIENEKVVWTIEMDVSQKEGYETCSLWEVSNVTLTSASDPIRFTFTGHWTYGAEHGSMEIDRDDGDNSFCLSW